MRVIDFFKKHITSEEKIRVDQIELFDEYEQWHLKCSHYTLVLAANGIVLELMNKLIDPSANYDFNYEPKSNLVGVSEFPLKFGVRFGHSMCFNEAKNILYVIGGFGESINEVGRHKRLNTIEVIDLNAMSLKITKSPFADRLFGTSCFFNDDNSICLIFGRSSPNKLYEMAKLVESCEKTDEEIEFLGETFEKTIETPKARWRHGSCKLKDERMVVFGGKTFNNELNRIETIDDCHIFKKETKSWEQIVVKELK